MSTKKMEIMFSSLDAEAQDEYVEIFGYDDNLDQNPIAIIEQEVEEVEED